MKFQLKETKEQIELIKAMGSKDQMTAMNAQSAFASLLSPLIDQVLPQIDTTTAFFNELRFNEDDDPSLALEPLLNEADEMLSIWYTSNAGGLPTNYVTAPIQEMKFSIYNFGSAISWDNKYARKARLNTISMYLERLIQTLLVKTNRRAWTALLTPLAATSYNGINQVKRAITAGLFTLDDLSKLMTRMRRQNESYVGGSTSGQGHRITDLYVSFEIFEQIREMAYNPINTKVGARITPAGGDGDAAGVVTMPDSERLKFFNDADTQSLFNVTLHEMAELGRNQVYNSLFDQVAGATAYTTPSDGGSATFNGANEELILGVDQSKRFAWRALMVDEDMSSAAVLRPDNQFYSREDKSGWFLKLDEGRIITNTRPMAGLII